MEFCCNNSCLWIKSTYPRALNHQLLPYQSPCMCIKSYITDVRRSACLLIPTSVYPFFFFQFLCLLLVLFGDAWSLMSFLVLFTHVVSKVQCLLSTRAGKVTLINLRKVHVALHMRYDECRHHI